MKIPKLKTMELFQVYVGLVSINLILLGIFAVRPAYKSLRDKQKTYKKLQETQTSLETKREFLIETEKIINETQKYLGDLEKVVPQKEALNSYLINLIRGASNSGFGVVELKKEASTEQLNLTIKFEGPETGLHKLVETLEDLERITNVKSANIIFEGNESDITLEVTIYTTNVNVPKNNASGEKMPTSSNINLETEMEPTP